LCFFKRHSIKCSQKFRKTFYIRAASDGITSKLRGFCTTCKGNEQGGNPENGKRDGR
jgi:hypothetical protein